MKLFRKRYFVGIITLDICKTRIPWPPFRLDWQGCVGPFDTKEAAEEIANKIRYAAKRARLKSHVSELLQSTSKYEK